MRDDLAGPQPRHPVRAGRLDGDAPGGTTDPRTGRSRRPVEAAARRRGLPLSHQRRQPARTWLPLVKTLWVPRRLVRYSASTWSDLTTAWRPGQKRLKSLAQRSRLFGWWGTKGSASG